MNTKIKNKRYLPSEIESLSRCFWKLVLFALFGTFWVSLLVMIIREEELSLIFCLIIFPFMTVFLLFLILFLLHTISIAKQKKNSIVVADGLVTITAPRSVFGLKIFTETLDVRKVRSYEIKKFTLVRHGYEHRKILIRMHTGEEKKFIVDNLALEKPERQSGDNAILPSFKWNLVFVLLLLVAFAVPVFIPVPKRLFPQVVYLFYVLILYLILSEIVKGNALSLERNGGLKKAKRYLLTRDVLLLLLLTVWIIVFHITGWDIILERRF
ncbi:MAG: hypothetical protein MJY84_08100 [Bacteroidales bacterium]|nr:hypothetical protein [Bacteroidales bacterium]